GGSAGFARDSTPCPPRTYTFTLIPLGTCITSIGSHPFSGFRLCSRAAQASVEPLRLAACLLPCPVLYRHRLEVVHQPLPHPPQPPVSFSLPASETAHASISQTQLPLETHPSCRSRVS